jgi:hypothetical protein
MVDMHPGMQAGVFMGFLALLKNMGQKYAMNLHLPHSSLLSIFNHPFAPLNAT